MLKGVPKNLSPEILKVLCEMGHGDEIVIADANFPSINKGVMEFRADGIGGVDMLKSILTLIPFDTYADANMLLMGLSGNDTEIPPIWEEYKNVADSIDKNGVIKYLDRFEFYDRAKKAYAVIHTGESAIYANIIIKKGVIK